MSPPSGDADQRSILKAPFLSKGRRNCATPLKVKTKQVLRDLRVFLIVVHQSRFSLLIQ